MAFKPVSIAAATHLIDLNTRKAAARKRDAKRAATRIRRRAERRDPESAPGDFRGGYLT